jgi:1-acyl-sn-glycerol-3-phosphate acyltransferase
MATESLWVPRSGCGPRCLPPPGAVRPAGPLRVTGRLIGVLGVLTVAVAAIPLLILGLNGRGRRVTRLICRLLLRALGVRHHLRGHRPARAALVVANHVSWVDVLVLMAYLPVRLVAKREVRGWPVVGLLARAAGTIFVDRSRPHALPATIGQVEAALRGGCVVGLFAEGTTWCGTDGGRFRPAMFQAAVDAGTAVAPVSLRFRLSDGTATTVAAFIGDDSLLSSVLRVVSGHGIHVDLRMHQALYPAKGACRRALAHATQASITGNVHIGHPAGDEGRGNPLSPLAGMARPRPVRFADRPRVAPTGDPAFEHKAGERWDRRGGADDQPRQSPPLPPPDPAQRHQVHDEEPTVHRTEDPHPDRVVHRHVLEEHPAQ